MLEVDDELTISTEVDELDELDDDDDDDDELSVDEDDGPRDKAVSSVAL